MSWTGPLLEAGGGDNRIQAGIEPGQNHVVAVKIGVDGLAMTLDGTKLLGPIPGLWVPSSLDWVSRGGELRLRNIVTTVEEVLPQPPQQADVLPQEAPHQSEVSLQPPTGASTYQHRSPPP